MSEAVIVKCPLCREGFDRSQYDDEAIIKTCKCENLTIEVKKMGEEKSLFTVTFKESEPTLKIPKIK